jgi:hypothetical protein
MTYVGHHQIPPAGLIAPDRRRVDVNPVRAASTPDVAADGSAPNGYPQAIARRKRAR